MAADTHYRIYEHRLDGMGMGSYHEPTYDDRGEAIAAAERLTRRYGIYCQYRVEAWYGDGSRPHRIVIIWNSIGQKEWVR